MAFRTTSVCVLGTKTTIFTCSPAIEMIIHPQGSSGLLLGYFHGENLHGIDGCRGFATGISGGSGNFVDDVEAGNDFAESDVVGGQIVVRLHDEELAAGGAGGFGSSLGHGDRAPEVFSVGGRSFGDGIARAASAIHLRVPALNHEALDDAVKNRISVETLAG